MTCLIPGISKQSFALPQFFSRGCCLVLLHPPVPLSSVFMALLFSPFLHPLSESHLAKASEISVPSFLTLCNDGSLQCSLGDHCKLWDRVNNICISNRSLAASSSGPTPNKYSVRQCLKFHHPWELSCLSELQQGILSYPALMLKSQLWPPYSPAGLNRFLFCI